MDLKELSVVLIFCKKKKVADEVCWVPCLADKIFSQTWDCRFGEMKSVKLCWTLSLLRILTLHCMIDGKFLKRVSHMYKIWSRKDMREFSLGISTNWRLGWCKKRGGRPIRGGLDFGQTGFKIRNKRQM